MHAQHFDAFARQVSHVTGRRRLLAGLALSPLAGLVARQVNEAEARKHRKNKKRKKSKKARPNAFGCLEVGDPCKSANQCCSGICEGKTCRAHDVGTCDQKRPGYCAEGNPNDASCNGDKGVCFRSTAGSNVCINHFECEACQRDTDCQALGYPDGAACVPITGDLACADLCQDQEVRMACVYFSSLITLHAEG